MKGILRNTAGDLMIENGTLQLGDISEDVAEVVMMSAAGELKHAPVIGANLVKSVNGTIDPFMPGKILKMLKAEGVAVKSLKINEGEITLEL